MSELQNKIMDYMKKTRFCSLIKANPSVSMVIHHDDPSAKDIRDTRGLLYSGRAEAVSEKDFDKVPDGVKKVYGMVNSYFPGSAVIFKVKPKKIIFIDYSKGFGYSDVLKF